MRQVVAGRGRRQGGALLIAALAGGHTVAGAAREARLSERTAYRRLADPAFRQAVATARVAPAASAPTACATSSARACATA